MEYAVTFSNNETVKPGAAENQSSSSFRRKKTFPLRGLLMQIDNSIFRRSSHADQGRTLLLTAHLNTTERGLDLTCHVPWW